MSGKYYPDEFKTEVPKQVSDNGHPVAEVASRLRISWRSRYEWIKQFGASECLRVETRGHGF